MDAQDIYSYINSSLDYNNHSCGVNDEILYYVAILEASFYQVETYMWIIFKFDQLLLDPWFRAFSSIN